MGVLLVLLLYSLPKSRITEIMVRMLNCDVRTKATHQQEPKIYKLVPSTEVMLSRSTVGDMVVIYFDLVFHSHRL